MNEIIDILADEQRIYDKAVSNVEAVRNGAVFDFEDYAKLTEDYGHLLVEHRRSIIISDTTTIDLYESNIDLTDKVYIDSLTGLYNRRFLEDSLNRITLSLLRSGGVLSVMMIDIDYFKPYNDTYGHSEGDTCLKEVAEAINKTLLRPDDFVARYGGEEFTVILLHTDKSGACFIAERILKSVSDRNIPHKNSEVASYVTVSIGLTTINSKYSQNGDDYLKQADKALYQSKQNGRDQYTFIEFS